MKGTPCGWPRTPAPRATGARVNGPIVVLDILDAGYRRHLPSKEWAAAGQLTMPVATTSGHASIETAVEATRIGAIDFLEKPIALQRLLAAVKRALTAPDRRLAPPLPGGRTRALARACRFASSLSRRSAPMKAWVCLRGEEGMLPELHARRAGCADGGLSSTQRRSSPR
jgi:DNA-binding NtrC family response regulator